MSRLLTDDKYVQTFTVRDGRLIITYFTQFLKLKSFNLALSDIVVVKLSKRLSIAAVWSPILDLKVDEAWIGFYVITKDLYRDIQNQLTSVNIAVVK